MQRPTAARPRLVETWLAALLVAACGAWVFRGTLALFFSADDFPALARAQGLLPRLSGPWRLLSGQWYFDVMRPIAGLNPLGYHAANLLLHAACAVGAFLLLRRRVSGPAALAGAACFAAHPSHFAAVYWVSGVGALLGTALVLATLFAALRTGALRWLALPLFVAALLARESAVLLPLVVAVLLHDQRREGRAPAWRDPLVLALAVIAVIQIVQFKVANVLGAVAYSTDFGSALWANLFSYLGWTANFLLVTVRGFQDAADPIVYGWGAGLLALWIAGAASPSLRRRGWLAAGLLYVALLLPVLPLGHHTYHYYLHGSLIGFGWCVAAAFDALFERMDTGAPPSDARRAKASDSRRSGAGARRPAEAGARKSAETGVRRPASPGAWRWAVAVAISALITWNGALLVDKIATMPLPGSSGLLSDATVDRSAIARRAVDDLRASPLPEHARVVFWSPVSRASAKGDGARETYFETNVRTALFDGLAVRLFVPAVDSVRFVMAYESLPEPYRYAVYLPDGRLRVSGSAELDSVLVKTAP